MNSIGEAPFAQLLDSIAAKTPSPGGGAAACANGALSAALAGMVVAYSLGKKDLAAHQPALTAADAYLARARALFLGLAAEDASAYGWLNDLQRLPPTDPRRVAEMPAAALACVGVPMAALAACVDVLRLLVDLAPITNRHLRSDLAIAAVLAEGAARSCAWNVRINLPALAESGGRAGQEKEADALMARAVELARAVEAACKASEK